MRLAGAVAALLALSFPASAQWTIVQLPEHVYTAVPFMIDVGIDCPPPGEAPPTPGCNGTMGVWFDAHDKTAFIPKGFTTIFPFSSVPAGPFVFHKPGPHVLDLLSLSREFPGEVILVGQVAFQVLPPGPARKKERAAADAPIEAKTLPDFR
jgi:hypothetical protein